MNKSDIIKRLEELDFDKNEYWLITGGAMVFYGLREDTNDIDLGCSKKMADELIKKYPYNIKNEKRMIRIGDDVEIFEGWLEDEVVFVDDFPLVSINGLLKMKRQLSREKDLRDIKLIEEYLQNEG